MTTPSTMLLSIGTRPEVIKMAPIYLELQRRGFKPLLLHTGQHDEMARELYELFGIIPDYTIELGRRSPMSPEAAATHCDLSHLGSLLLEKISAVLMQADPSVVLVHGDTSSALMTALAAFYQKRKIAHIEAGLRSYREYHPFPEEKNRALIGRLAHWHFAPTQRALKNLISEGIPQDTVHMVGNTIVQAAQLGVERLDRLRKDSASKFAAGMEAKNDQRSLGAMAVHRTDMLWQSNHDLIGKLEQRMQGKRLALVTVHRRENHETGIQSIARATLALMQEHKDLLVVWPVHPNPKVKALVDAELGNVSVDIAERLYLTKPLRYPVLLWILKHSWVVMTDSGGIQEEAVALHTPVMVLRETTERPEVIEVGAGVLVGANKDDIVRKFNELSVNTVSYKEMCHAENPFGDEKVAANICNVLLN